MNETIKEILLRYTGRKFVAAVGVSTFVVFAPSLGITLNELQLDFLQWVLLGFIGIEGGADIVSRVTNIPKQDEPKAKSSSKSR